MSYRLNIAGKTDRGRRRPKNEDNFVVEPELGFMIHPGSSGAYVSLGVGFLISRNESAFEDVIRRSTHSLTH